MRNLLLPPSPPPPEGALGTLTAPPGGGLSAWKIMIQITAAQVTIPETTERDQETGKLTTVAGEGRDRYWLTDQPDIAAAAPLNALNKLCRRLVGLGMTGPAEVRGVDGRLRFTVASVEEAAQVDRRERRDGRSRREKYRPFPGILEGPPGSPRDLPPLSVASLRETLSPPSQPTPL